MEKMERYFEESTVILKDKYKSKTRIPEDLLESYRALFSGYEEIDNNVIHMTYEEFDKIKDKLKDSTYLNKYDTMKGWGIELKLKN